MDRGFVFLCRFLGELFQRIFNEDALLVAHFRRKCAFLCRSDFRKELPLDERESKLQHAVSRKCYKFIISVIRRTATHFSQKCAPLRWKGDEVKVRNLSKKCRLRRLVGFYWAGSYYLLIFGLSACHSGFSHISFRIL